MVNQRELIGLAGSWRIAIKPLSKAFPPGPDEDTSKAAFVQSKIVNG